MPKSTHSWTFFRAGGDDQIVLRTGSDMEHLGELDLKLWVALACPTKGTEIEERTLDLIDTDHDGRIRPPEVLAAIEWCKKVFKDLDILLQDGDRLPLSAFNRKTDEGKAVLASAKRILKDGGRSDAQDLSVDDVAAMEKLFVATRFNGDGIVPAESADEESTQKAIADIILAMGSVVDRSGKPGIDQAIVDKFFERALAVLTWHAESRKEGLMPIGEKTGAAADAVSRIAHKLDDYFTRCRLAAFDARGSTTLNAPESELLALAAQSLETSTAGVLHLPISRIEAGRALPLEAGINPAWSADLTHLNEAAIQPLLGGSRTSLTEADWATIRQKLAPHLEWLGRKIEIGSPPLAIERIAELLDGGAKAAIEDLIRQDTALEVEYAQIASVEKAVRFRRELARLLRNFVNFADFYGSRGASFQAGKLYVDARECDLCIFVNDPAKHAALAGLSSAYLAYCDCTRLSGEKRGIVAVISAGDTDHLMVGRNGVFYDRKGVDWDATITSVVENPISIRQAFWSPYKRLIRLIEEQVAKRASEKEKAANSQLEGAATAAATVDQAKPAAAAPAAPPPAAPAAPAPAAAVAAAPPAPEPEKKFDVGTLAAIGLVVTGIATFLSSVFATFLGLGMWMPLGLAALVLAISGPSMLIAWLKLRRRSLGPILDANGWAVNSRARINVPFGTSLTSLAVLPDGSQRTIADPYAEKPTRWFLWALPITLLVIALVWFTGTLDRYLPERMQATVVLHRTPPPPQPPPTTTTTTTTTTEAQKGKEAPASKPVAPAK